MRLCQESEADDRGGEAKEGLLNVNESIEASAKADKGVQPGIGSLDGPTTRLSQTAAVFGIALGDDRCYSQPTQDGS
jgi:hypothetical protein